MIVYILWSAGIIAIVLVLTWLGRYLHRCLLEKMGYSDEEIERILNL